jgi:hypothetical protein
MTKLGLIGPIALMAIGLFAIFAGSSIASTEESIANSIGNLLSNKWVAIGLIVTGGFILAHNEGYLSKV